MKPEGLLWEVAMFIAQADFVLAEVGGGSRGFAMKRARALEDQAGKLADVDLTSLSPRIQERLLIAIGHVRAVLEPHQSDD